jgi:hypothetical protein
MQALLMINEVLPMPAELDWDGDGAAGESDEWIELTNEGNRRIDLTGWSLASGDYVYALPPGTLLDPGAFLVLFKNQTGIGLDNAGGQVQLLGPKGKVRDSIIYPTLQPDGSYSRDETGTWHSDWPPSPGRPNQPAGPELILLMREPANR